MILVTITSATLISKVQPGLTSSGFSHLRMRLNRGGIPLPPHAIDILPYACDANIDTKCYTVCIFIIATYKETYLILLIH